MTRRLRAAVTAVIVLASVLALGGGVGRSADASYELRLSTSPTRTAPTALEGATASDRIYVFLTPESGIVEVRFHLDDPQRKRRARKVERNAPWDFAGTATDDTALAFDTELLSDGIHTITAAADLSSGGTVVVTSTFVVDNVSAPPSEPGPPDQVHLAWVSDPSTSLVVVWRTQEEASPSIVEFRPVGGAAWQTASGSLRPSGADGVLHEVEITGLSPGTTYEYRAPGDGDVWSPTFRTRTAPAPGPSDFDAVYVADTGLIGRTDGLTTGTQQVIDEIARLDPLVVLPGGDYIYYNTDKRYGTLDASIDAWFDQMQPIATRAPLMPVYGNHEALLGEGFAPWAARFPTPQGFDGRRNYSFDIGEAHFIALFAVEETTALPGATVEWIEEDVAAARARGQQWIIPYFHVSPFSEGKNHSSNIALRAQLGPLFERLGVKVAIASHDQSYERTWPLVDVPATNTPTSTDPSCYEPTDGITWVKVSPGGKLSNKNGSFSEWASATPPPWTAYRDNTMHHFLRLRFSAVGDLRVEAYGLKGDGSPPVVQDSFVYTAGTCPPRLSFDVGQAVFALEEGETASRSIALASTGDTPADFTATDDADWLTVSPSSGETPTELTVSVTSAGLAAGVYRATVTAAAAGHAPATLPVTLTVGGAYEVAYSMSNNRSGAQVLDGASVMGKVYIFARPEVGGVRASFWLDDPTMSGAPRRVENNPPWDFAGGTVSTATAFDTKTISDGLHTITVALDAANGTREVAAATFTVANDVSPPPPPPSTTTHSLLVSLSSDRTSPSLLEGASATRSIFVFTDPELDTTRVRFWLDDPARSRTPRKVENNGPWDFMGTNSDGTRSAIPFDTRTIADGTHVITAEVRRADGSLEILHGTFSVLNDAP